MAKCLGRSLSDLEAQVQISVLLICRESVFLLSSVRRQVIIGYSTFRKYLKTIQRVNPILVSEIAEAELFGEPSVLLIAQVIESDGFVQIVYEVIRSLAEIVS